MLSCFSYILLRIATMLHLCVCFALAAVLAVVSACSNHDPEKTKIANERRKELERKWSNDVHVWITSC